MLSPVYLIVSGGVYMFSDTGPSTAALVYNSGTQALQIDMDPNAANALDIRQTSSGQIVYF